MNNIILSEKVKNALSKNLPVLALESSILAQGMPYPESYAFAKRAENLCNKSNVTPATIAILNGIIHVGLENKQLKFVCKDESIKKISKRELGLALSQKWNCSTTVSSSLHIANLCGIKVFSTGGIGGVHRGYSSNHDVSQDINALSENPIIVITAGPKAVLNINKTVEVLESNGVTSIGYKTDEYPSFYSVNSGVFGLERINSAKEIVDVYLNNLNLGLSSSILVSNPIPKAYEVSFDKINTIVFNACEKAKQEKIKGKELTPFLLKEVSLLTDGKSLEVNICLALNNIQLGIRVLKELFEL
jgi:pseudouridine-5'-phosphate glycosidase